MKNKGNTLSWIILAALGLFLVIGHNAALDIVCKVVAAGLVLTGIVVSVSVSAFSLALIQRVYGVYGTTDLRRLLEAMKKRGE